jgi:iron complex outermembrane receptor protein
MATIGQQDFNQGYIADPLQLIQGKLAGVQIYNRGGNPNTPSLMRVRGLSAMTQRQPLIVIDGMVGASLDALDPNDVARISVLTDGSAQALYGMRASNGVVLIETKSGKATTAPLSVEYTGQVGLATPYEGIAVMDANTFRSANGLDLGSATVWEDEILRNGLNQLHGLALQGYLPKSHTRYRIAGHYRQAEGVLQGSGFDQVNLRASIHTDFGLDKLDWQLSSAYTHRNNQFGMPEALGYATYYNPTAPVLGSAAPYTFNAEQYGGYYELLGLFQAYNPKAMIELNERFGQQQTFNATSLLSYALTDQWNIHFRYGYQDQFENRRAFYGPQSFYRGNAFGGRAPKGRADLIDLDQSLAVYDLYTNLQLPLGQSKLTATLGTSYTDARYDDRSFSFFGIEEKARIEQERIGDFADWENETSILNDAVFNGWRHQLLAYFGQANLNIKDRYFFDLSMRYEGSSRLGTDSQWGLFPAVGAGVDFAEYLPKVDQLKFRVGYGITGALPDQAGLAKERTITQINAMGEATTSVDREANPALKWEEKRELNVGLDFQMGALSAFANWYQREVSDWIMLDQESFFNTRYTNQNALSGSGLELGIDLNLASSEQFEYTTGLRLSAYKAEFTELPQELVFLSTACCAQAEPLIVLKEGEAIGGLQGPTFSGEIDAEGDQIYADINADGQVNTAIDQIYTPESDLSTLGNGLPSMELGWVNQLRWGQWELHVFFRAALGHSLVNQARQFWEPRTPFANPSPYNYVQTDLAIENLQLSRYSSLYVEQADFLKLDYLSLARHFRLKSQPDHPITVSITVQNLLLASNYTGADPEPVLEDQGFNTFISPLRQGPTQPLKAGIDRLGDYRPATAFVLGVRAGF